MRDVSIRMGRARAFVVVFAMAVGVMLGAPAQAHAAPPNEPGVLCAQITGATVCFESSGDDFHVYDSATDGASARANWYVDYDRETPHCTNSNGSGTWHECTYDMREGATVCFRPEVYDASEGRLIRYGVPWTCTEV
ncbi:hypothetical protein [Allostreptomyces psammosilenae]|uniref:Secreted protein n=1 Tax=Allostreptomyces psammosilenae TaxID=1892865 RepID=A0A852ZN27_9ACTN|nr:hypothetical protein [Allostreptomyces psammosilenae]NYI03809.1 hypothetical protein [Allostreptomyces psammosilenae]